MKDLVLKVETYQYTKDQRLHMPTAETNSRKDDS